MKYLTEYSSPWHSPWCTDHILFLFIHISLPPLFTFPTSTLLRDSFLIFFPSCRTTSCSSILEVTSNNSAHLILSSPVKMISRSPSPEFSPLAIGEDLTPLPIYKAASTTTIDFDGLLREKHLKLHEDLKTGCGGQLWPAGMLLSKQMLRYWRDKLGEARM